jgi:carbon-monoxide dehydrogenase medium subunit
VYLSDIELHHAGSPEQAAELLSRYGPDARLLAGGTDLLVNLKTQRDDVRHLISIAGIPALRGIRRDPRGLHIGPLTTLSDLLAASDCCAGPYIALHDAVSQMAATQIRNMATVGGNVAGAVPCADLPPVLSVLNATVVLRSPTAERTLRIDDLIVGPRETAANPDEILSAILVPDPGPRHGAAYARLGLRAGNAIAVASVAAALTLDEAGAVHEARVALGAVAPIPKLVPVAAAALVGTDGDPDGDDYNDALDRAAAAAMAAAEPITDLRGTAEYRRDMVGVLTRRAVQGALQRARGEVESEEVAA